MSSTPGQIDGRKLCAYHFRTEGARPSGFSVAFASEQEARAALERTLEWLRQARGSSELRPRVTGLCGSLTCASRTRGLLLVFKINNGQVRAFR